MYIICMQYINSNIFMTTKFHQLPTFKQSIKNDTSKSKSKNTLHFYGGSTAATIDMHNQECPFC